MKKAGKQVVIAVSAAALGASLLAGCGSKESKGTIRVGSKSFTESEITAEIYSLALEDAGYKVERVFDIANDAIHTAITNDEVDFYPEYTGTGLIAVLGMEALKDPQEVYDTVKEAYEDQFQITWLDYAEVNNGFAIVVNAETAQDLGLSTLSDLQKNASKIRFAAGAPFQEREDGLPGMNEFYGTFEWADLITIDPSLKYTVLENDEADATHAAATEGQLSGGKYTILEDDKQLWPPYNLAPIVRDNVLEENPEIADVLNKVSAKLTTENVAQMNGKVDLDGEEYKDVAKEFYESIK